VLDLDPHDFVVLFTGSLVAEKGVAQLLQAFARSMAVQPNARLVFVGTGRKADALEKLAGELGVSRQVALVGYRPDDELPDWYAACDVFALPTQSEGLSISLLEAMASARPVITTYPDIGDHDAVEHGVNGLLCPYDDVDALAAALSTLVQSPDVARQMGTSARKKAEKHFSWPVIARQVFGVYREVFAEAESKR
jgi:glycosyltransferase involved in cell wall biosynthesis